MGTHPIFESDFDCLTETMSRKLNAASKKQRENATKRLRIEMAELALSPIPGIVTHPKTDDNIFEWTAFIKGPVDSVYETGTFEFELSFPSEYPFKPPTCKFKTRIYHCNINSTGHVCIDMLQESVWI